MVVVMMMMMMMMMMVMLCPCRVTSAVDGRSLDGVHSLRTQHDSEFESDGRVIRCTEVSFSGISVLWLSFFFFFF